MLQSNATNLNQEEGKLLLMLIAENGLGYAGLKTFCHCMNMPPPMSQTSFDDTNCSVHNAYVDTCQESMKKAAKEVREKRTEEYPTSVDKDSIVNTKVSGDGVWQKRGYSSLNGVMTLISNGKCIDQEVMTKKCRQCDLWEHRKVFPVYQKLGMEPGQFALSGFREADVARIKEANRKATDKSKSR